MLVRPKNTCVLNQMSSVVKSIALARCHAGQMQEVNPHLTPIPAHLNTKLWA